MEGPLILVLVKFFLKFIAYLFSLLAIPVTLYSIVVNKILKFETKDNSFGHFLIFIPRILLVLPFFFSFPLLAYLYGWLVDKAIADSAAYVPYVIAVGFLVAIAIGYWFTRAMGIFKDSISKMAITGSESYFKGVGESLLDIGATIAFMLSIVTVIRIPFMIISLIYRNEFDSSKKSIRTNLYRHMFLIPFDILCLPSFLFVLVTVLRAPSLFASVKKDYSTVWRKCFNLALRLEILKNAFFVILEVGIMLLSFIFILSPWRISLAISEFKRGKTQGQKFGLWFVQEMNGLLDLGVIILSLPLLISFYRIPYAYRKIFSTSNTTARERRWEALFQSMFVIVDIFIILFSLFILVTIYRVPRTIRKVINRPNRYYEKIAVQFIKIWRDLPFFLMALIVTIFLWRAPFMIVQWFKSENSKKGRDVIKHHFLWMWVDILDLPFVLSSFIILLTLWRAYAFVCGFITMDTRRKQRVFVIKQIFYWLMDIPTFFGLLLITITVYRLPKTYRLLRNYFKYTNFSKIDNSSTLNSPNNNLSINRVEYEIDDIRPPSSNDDEDNPAPPIAATSVSNNSNSNAEECERFSSWRKAVLSQLFLLLIDIPFPVLLLLTLWRLPILISRLKEIKDPIRKYSLRRLLILRYVLLALLDILCIIPTLFILITVWRIPSFISMVKSYQRGDNEHKLLGSLFWDTLVDIPFVLMGLITMPIPWRGPFLIKAIFVTRECKNDKEARIMAAKYLLFTLLDLIILIECLFLTCTIWRIKTFFDIVKEELEDTVGHNVSTTSRFRKSLCVLYSASVCCIIVFVDIFKFAQLLIICLFVKQALPLFRAIKACKVEKGDNFQLKDIMQIISYYFMETLMDIPHVFLIPIKLLAFPFIPIHLYLAKRTNAKNNKLDGTAISYGSTMSIIGYPLLWMHELSANSMTYYGLDKFFIINLLGIALIAINELSLIVVFINCFYMFFVTLFSPLWKSTMEKYGWTALGKAQGPMVILEYITVVLQAFLFPVFILIQIAILLLPTLLSLGFYPSPNLDFVEYWKSFFTERSFWREASQFSNGIWVAQAFWFLVCLVSWQVTFQVGKKYIPIFSPWKSYYWLVKKVLHGRIWFCYTWLLIKGTRICYRLRRTCLIGELLMFPLFVIWTCWSFVIPIVTKIYLIFIGSGIISLALIVVAYKIVKVNWKDNAGSKDGEIDQSKNQPIMSIDSIECELPESGGIVFKFRGKKSYHQTLIQIRDARLSLEGEKLWDAIYSIVGRTKVRAALMVVGYPISLVPMFLNIEDVNNNTGEADRNGNISISFNLNIGIQGSKFLMKKKLITRMLNQIREIDNSQFQIVIEHGKKNFGWEKHGLICKFNTTISTLLENTINSLNDDQILPPPITEILPFEGDYIHIPPAPFTSKQVRQEPKKLQKPVPLVMPGERKVSDDNNSNSSSSSSPDQARGANIRDSIEYQVDEESPFYQEEEDKNNHYIDVESVEVSPEQIEIERQIKDAAKNATTLSNEDNYYDGELTEEFLRSLDKSNNV